jgi:mutator protein MutT
VKVHECVSFIFVDDDRLLLEKRSMAKEADPGLITIPGGHIEQGETQRDALFREVMEEFGVSPMSSVYICSLYHPTTELQLIHYYVVNSWQGDIRPIEAESLMWVSLSEPEPAGIAADNVALAEFKRVFPSLVLGTK